MKFSLNWLSRYVNVSDVSIDELANRFTLSVAELEGVETVGENLSTVVIAHIKECTPHPNADRLQVCQVDDGSDTLRTIVCGAPNARPGLVTALALPKTQLGDFKIKVSKVRGVESAGMLCAMSELGLGGGNDGIWELPSDWEAGTPLPKVLDVIDTLFEVDNKSITHRPDLWGHYGIAREIAGLLNRPLTPPSTSIDLGQAESVAITLEDTEACPRYTALKIEGVQVEEAPLWMQLLLHRCETRAINNVVDTTNFVMMELGNPIHAFDAREIQGDAIRVRHAQDDEKVVTLDDQERSLRSNDLLICDAQRPVALAGIMGLENSEVRDDTTALLLEAANFKSEGVRRTALRLGLRTDASARFEKSLDPALAAQAGLRFATLLHEICPSVQVVSRLGDVWPNPPKPISISTSVSYINDRLGTSLSTLQIHQYLTSIQFEINDLDGDQMVVGVPSFRATKDVSIQEDLVEEVGRLFGYDNIVPLQPRVEIPKPYRHPKRTLHRKVRTWLSFHEKAHEVRNYSFDLDPLLEKIGLPKEARLELKNPLSSEQRFMRNALLPNLIGALDRSSAYAHDLCLYEIGRTFKTTTLEGHPAQGSDLPYQPYHLSALVWKSPKTAPQIPIKNDRSIHTYGYQQQGELAYAELKGIATRVSSALDLDLLFERNDGNAPVWLHPNRCALVSLIRVPARGRMPAETVRLGYMGQVHPDICSTLSLGQYCAAFEWDLSPLEEDVLSYGQYKAISRYPHIDIDLSVIVPENVHFDQVAVLMKNAHRSWIQDVRCVSVYRGTPIPEGQKSLTIQMVFQSDRETLEKEAVNKVIEKLTTRLKSELNGWVRL
jgi:phenylalanyl-tRNA synthetase beta chain